MQARARGRLAIVSRAGRKRLQLEIACTSRNVARRLIEEFGGRAEKWTRDWLKRSADLQESKPLKIGKRLVISNARETLASRQPQHQRRSNILIPGFCRFRDRSTRNDGDVATLFRTLDSQMERWLVACRSWDRERDSRSRGETLGAGGVTGIDIDPKAISIAKANARLNKINNVDFRLGDLRKWKPAGTRDIIAANLYRELLIKILPDLSRCTWLILSGVLRTQENKFLRVLRRNNKSGSPSWSIAGMIDEVYLAA